MAASFSPAVASSHADKNRVVMDNLNTHNKASRRATFAAAEARRIAKRLELHHTPTPARFLRSERAASVGPRHADGVRIKWLFDVDKARHKMGHHDPEPLLSPSTAA